MKQYLPIVLIAICMTSISACDEVGVFEKNTILKNRQWATSDRQNISFDISDTNALYNVFITLRHNDAYKYNNIWINVYTRAPNDSKAVKQQLDLTLGNNDKGWLGSGMDDIYYHRVRITREPVQFHKIGAYEFSLEQIMRDDPLENIMNVGLRIEKAN